MSDQLTQRNKATVWNYWQELNASEAGTVADIVRRYVDDDISWHGSHPLNDLHGSDELIDGFWRPLVHAVPDIKKYVYLFFGDTFEGGHWVTGTGYLSGTFTNNWLDIPATGEEIHIRFGEFSRLEDERIVESYVLLDLVDVMRQAGISVLPPSAGAEGIVPEPATDGGVLLEPQNEAETEKSLDLVEAMIGGLLRYDQEDLRSMGMKDYWHPDMHWYGPSGIGACHSLAEFEDYHQRPFLHAFPDRHGGDHVARVAEGLYVGTAGWPSLEATHAGDYLGVPATGRNISMRVMDWWRREDDLLIENWVLIDMVELFLQFDVDLFARMHSEIQEEEQGIS